MHMTERSNLYASLSCIMFPSALKFQRQYSSRGEVIHVFIIPIADVGELGW